MEIIMAHIKVTRRSMRPEEYISLRFGWLKRLIYKEKEEIPAFFIREARQISDNEYEFFSDDYSPLNKGDMYFTPDGTAFLKADVSIPEKWKNDEVWLSLKTAGEMTVKINGKYAGGLDPNRDRIPVSSFADNLSLHIEIEGYNRSKPDDERNPESLSVRGCRQIFEGGYLCIIDNDILSLVYDIELIYDAAMSGAFDEDFSAMAIRELDTALDCIDFDNITAAQIKNAQEYIERKIYANKNYQGSGSVALIGHSHLDLAYYWRRIHTVQKNLRTVIIQMRLMDRYPDFIYTHTQPFIYETLEKYYPDVFEELKEKIKSGQFEPVGAMYVEPDCNIPCAESLIRQCLYGQKYYREKFGITVDNCWLPDVFGNSWILPQILKKSGVNYFVSNKMSTWNDTNRFPHNNFIWKGIDGTRIFACVPPTHFISWNEPSQIKENWDSYQDKDVGGSTMQMFGYGDGGSGCTEEMIELMHRFDKLSVMPHTEHIGGKDFLHKTFDGNDGNLAVWDGELYLEMHRGTFTTKSYLKRMNRKLEFKLRDAEIINIAKYQADGRYPDGKIRDLYKLLLVNQFHDILPGSHIAPVCYDAVNDLEKIDRELDSVIPNGDYYFNTLNFRRTEPVFIENGGPTVRHGKNGTYMITTGEPLNANTVYSCGKNDWYTLNGFNCETDYYRIVFNNDGSMASLFDKELNREWVNGDFNKLHFYRDCPGNYDAWDILPDYEDVEYDFSVKKDLSFLHSDSTVLEFETVLNFNNSIWKRVIRLFRFSRGIEVENTVDWHEKHKLCKAVFDLNVLSRELICDTSAGYIKRETHRNTSWQQARFEVCHHKWCCMEEVDGGVALLNEGKYGVGAKENRISLSLLRATVRPDVNSDIGEHNFCYMIMPYAGSFINAGINRKAYEYNVPLVKTDVSELNLPIPSELILQSVKKSEDGKMIVIRLSEQDGRRGSFKLNQNVKLLNMLEDIEKETDTVSYNPFEIITYAIEI